MDSGQYFSGATCPSSPARISRSRTFTLLSLLRSQRTSKPGSPGVLAPTSRQKKQVADVHVAVGVDVAGDGV